jgi:peptidoglycan hydrolase CwlO-like protein
LDARGIEIDGQKIKGIIADVGDTAAETAENMHYVGSGGALAFAENEQFLVRYSGLIRDYQEITGKSTQEATNDVRKYLTESYQKQAEASKSAQTEAGKQKKSFEELSKEIDSVKSSYDTISSAIEEFNTYGALSADTIKDLISLEPEYLNLLIDENGQLNLTSESYEELYRAKLRDMLVSQVRTTLNNILNMKEEEAAAYALADAYDTETDSLEALVKAEFSAAYATAATKDAANNTTTYTDAIDRYATIVPTLMSLVNSAQIDAAESTNVATDALNAQKDALEDEKDALEDQKDALEDQKDALEDLKDEWEDYKDDLSDAKDKIQELIDVTIDYIKQTKEDEKDAISERKDAFDELIEKEKEELEVKKEAAEFAETLREKENAVAKNALSVAIASLDDSGAGQKARKQAEDDLVESRADLYSELADHEYDVRVAALDNLKDTFDEYYDSEIDKIDKYLDNERQIYNDACAMIENDTGDLYATLWQYTYEYTTKTRAEFDNMWNSAQAAMEEYNVAQYGVIGVMEFLNAEIYNCEAQIDALDGQIDILDTSIDELDTKIDAVSESIENLADNSINKLTTQIGNLKKEIAELQDEKGDIGDSGDDDSSRKQKYYVKFVPGNLAMADGSMYRSSAVFSYYGTRDQAIAAIQQKIQEFTGGVAYSDAAIARRLQTSGMSRYASGTLSARGGLSEVNEQGHEIRILNKGDGILTAKITRNLSNLGSDPVSFLADAGKKLLSKIGSFGLFSKPVTNPTTTYAVSNGGDMPITITNHINGDVNPSTLKALEKAQKDITQNAINGMMKMTLGSRNSSRVI